MNGRIVLRKPDPIHAIVPIKKLSRCKSRLSDIISVSERRLLALAMFRHVVGVLAEHSNISRVSVLTEAPSDFVSEVPDGVKMIDETKLCNTNKNLNSCLRASLRAFCDKNKEHILIVHGDLPLLAENDISAVVRSLSQGYDLVFGSDKKAAGTNLLAFRRELEPDFFFGKDSLRRHTQWAFERGYVFTCLNRIGIGLDVDTDQDLLELIVSEDGGIIGKDTAKILTKLAGNNP